MKKIGVSWRCLYRFPALYLSLLALSALTYRLMPPTGLSRAFTLICSSIFLLFQLYSTARLLILFEDPKKLYQGDKTEKERLRFLWNHPETRLYLLLLLLLPWPLPTFRAIFGTLSPLLYYLATRAFTPLFALLFLFGCTTGLVFHEQNEKKKEKRKKINRAPLLFLFHVFKFVPIYAVASYCLLAFSVVLVSLPGIAALFFTSSLGAAVLIVTATLWLIRSIRGVRIRKRFLAQLKDACESRGLPMPDVPSPIRSLFRKKERAPLFTLTVDGRKYACRLVSTLTPNTVHRFYPSGELGRVRVMHMRFMMRGAAWFGSGMLFRQRVELFETKYKMGFTAEEDTQKIFIFNPCSKTVEGAYGDKNVPLDNGMKIGDYTFYTATGFTNALTRGCLHRRANE